MLEDKDYPIIIGYHHVRKSKRLFDFSNSVEIIQDLLTAHNFIEDDDRSTKYSTDEITSIFSIESNSMLSYLISITNCVPYLLSSTTILPFYLLLY